MHEPLVVVLAQLGQQRLHRRDADAAGDHQQGVLGAGRQGSPPPARRSRIRSPTAVPLHQVLGDRVEHLHVQLNEWSGGGRLAIHTDRHGRAGAGLDEAYWPGR